MNPDLRVLAASTGQTGQRVSVYDRGYAQFAFHEPVRESFENRERISHAASPVSGPPVIVVDPEYSLCYVRLRADPAKPPLWSLSELHNRPLGMALMTSGVPTLRGVA